MSHIEPGHELAKATPELLDHREQLHRIAIIRASHGSFLARQRAMTNLRETNSRSRLPEPALDD
ncbi:MAG TPA: hypothetical protein VFN77_01680 [Acetobacteraceae bacterium]|nr:hypothetical protein [Acetobacteraceae bacterium]